MLSVFSVYNYQLDHSHLKRYRSMGVDLRLCLIIVYDTIFNRFSIKIIKMIFIETLLSVNSKTCTKKKTENNPNCHMICLLVSAKLTTLLM